MHLVEGPVSLSVISEIIANLKEESLCGGHSLFLGQVRADIVDGKQTIAIEYSAYDEMVFSEIEKIKSLILEEFSDAKQIEIIHSTGLVKCGEISLFVMVSAGHRRHALDACSRTVELVKERLPVWKKEIFGDQSSRWKPDER